MRYWACSGAPGADTAVDKAQMKIGRRLAIKLLNASKFVLGLGAVEAAADQPIRSGVTEPHRPGHARPAGRPWSTGAPRSFEAYSYHQALERTEKFFWGFCDDYLELVKARAYGDRAGGAESARAALRVALDTLLRLFAPFLPFVTEEVWSWWRQGSVHRAPWPDTKLLEEAAVDADPAVLTTAAALLADVRKAKSTNKRSLRTEVTRLTVEDAAEQIGALRVAEADLRRAGVVTELEFRESAERSVTVGLAPPTE